MPNGPGRPEEVFQLAVTFACTDAVGVGTGERDLWQGAAVRGRKVQGDRRSNQTGEEGQHAISKGGKDGGQDLAGCEWCLRDSQVAEVL